MWKMFHISLPWSSWYKNKTFKWNEFSLVAKCTWSCESRAWLSKTQLPSSFMRIATINELNSHTISRIFRWEGIRSKLWSSQIWTWRGGYSGVRSSQFWQMGCGIERGFLENGLVNKQSQVIWNESFWNKPTITFWMYSQRRIKILNFLGGEQRVRN